MKSFYAVITLNVAQVRTKKLLFYLKVFNINFILFTIIVWLMCSRNLSKLAAMAFMQFVNLFSKNYKSLQMSKCKNIFSP